MAAVFSHASFSWYSYFTRDVQVPVYPTTNAAIFRPLNWSRCPIPLQSMAPRIYLCSFATDQDGAMLSHFLIHYIDRLGLLPTQMRIYIFAIPQGEGLRERPDVMEMLKQRGTQAQLLRMPFNDTYKLELLNAFLRALPSGAWITSPDVDELYHYPCSRMGWLAEHFDLFCGHMEDMLAANGGLEALRFGPGAPDIQVQYPHRCRIRASSWGGHLRGFTATKVVLARVHPSALRGAARQFRNVHAFTTTAATATSPDCHKNNVVNLTTRSRLDIGPFSHYTLMRESLWRTLRKNQLHENEYAARLQSDKRDSADPPKHPGTAFALKGSAAANDSWSVCGLRGKSLHSAVPGLCLDYHHILRAMEVIYNGSQGEGTVPTSLCLGLPNFTSSLGSGAEPFQHILQRETVYGT